MDIIKKIDEAIEQNEENLINDTMRLININSEESPSEKGAPFGKGAKELLDTVIEMGEKEGFYTRDYGVGVISLALEKAEADLGIWAHGDVVPAGEGWTFGAYNATRVENCIVGRGATDNKGQLSAMFNLLKIFKKLGIKLNFNPALYVGSNEESGMKDLKGDPTNPEAKGYINLYKAPKLSLVPDSSYPVGYGARGLTIFKIRSKKAFDNFSLSAGLDDAPGKATAVFDDSDLPHTLEGCTVTKGEKTVITSFSPPLHTTRPDPNGNMITKITSALMTLDKVSPEDKKILEFYRDISLDTKGHMFNIDVESELMPSSVVFAKVIEDFSQYSELEIRVRFPIDITHEELEKRIKKVCFEKGFEVECTMCHKPYVNDDKNIVVEELTKIANEMTGTDKKPYINGSTYAHYLPNAYIFGLQAGSAPSSFPEGRGGAHGIDESVSIDRLKLGMKIYARALLKLNEIDW